MRVALTLNRCGLFCPSRFDGLSGSRLRVCIDPRGSFLRRPVLGRIATAATGEDHGTKGENQKSAPNSHHCTSVCVI